MTLARAGSPITADMINRQYTLADSSLTTVTAATAGNLSSVYTILASDAGQGTCYRLTCSGTGTWGSTQQKLTLNMALAGTSIGTTPAIAAAAFSASAAFAWKLVLEIMCTSTGAAGTWGADLAGVFTQTASNILPGTAADNTVPLAGCTTSDVTQDTTIANTLAVQAAWASVTGSPAISCNRTKFERLAA